MDLNAKKEWRLEVAIKFPQDCGYQVPAGRLNNWVRRTVRTLFECSLTVPWSQVVTEWYAEQFCDRPHAVLSGVYCQLTSISPAARSETQQNFQSSRQQMAFHLKGFSPFVQSQTKFFSCELYNQIVKEKKSCTKLTPLTIYFFQIWFHSTSVSCTRCSSERSLPFLISQAIAKGLNKCVKKAVPCLTDKFPKVAKGDIWKSWQSWVVFCPVAR